MPNLGRTDTIAPSQPIPLQAAVLIAGVGAFAVLTWTSQQMLGPLWDEVTDQQIAETYLTHPLYGSGIDGSQMRLPMAVNAVVFAVTGPSLAVSRLLSVIVGSVTIVAAFFLARRIFGSGAAMLTAMLLALSPYFLAFGRIAMTEGDIYPACFVTLTCLAYYRFAERRTGPWLALLSVMLGLAVASKLYALFLIPAIVVCERTTRRGRGSSSRVLLGAADRTEPRWTFAGVCIAVGIAAGAACVALTQLRHTQPAIAAWFVLVACTVGLAGWMVSHRRVRFGPLSACVLMTILAGFLCGAAFPEHLLHPEILRSIARRTARWDHRVPGTLVLGHLRLYAGIVLVFATPPVGLAMVGSLVWGWWREADRPELRLTVVGLSLFLLAMLMLPLHQTFYLMTIWPMLAVLTAGGLIHARGWLAKRSASGGRLATVGIVLLVAQLVYAAGAGWPHYNLYARRWVGSRWLGAEARGYRNLVQTPCDGYGELIAWCLDNVRPDQTVVSYLCAEHVVDELLPEDVPFRLIPRGLREAANRGEPAPPGPAIDKADVVLLHINNIVAYDDMPPADVLERRFGGQPAFVVMRDGDLPIAMAYVARDVELRRPSE